MDSKVTSHSLSPKCNGDWSAWVSEHLGRSETFAEKVAELRALASVDHKRTTGPLASYSWPELEALRPPDRDREDARKGVVRGHRNPEHGGGYSLAHRDKYCERVRAASRRFIGTEAWATNLHDHVRTGRPLTLPASEHPRPHGSVASRVAVHVGAAVGTAGGATAMREAWRRARPHKSTTDNSFTFARDE